MNVTYENPTLRAAAAGLEELRYRGNLNFFGAEKKAHKFYFAPTLGADERVALLRSAAAQRPAFVRAEEQPVGVPRLHCAGKSGGLAAALGLLSDLRAAVVAGERLAFFGVQPELLKATVFVQRGSGAWRVMFHELYGSRALCTALVGSLRKKGAQIEFPFSVPLPFLDEWRVAAVGDVTVANYEHGNMDEHISNVRELVRGRLLLTATRADFFKNLRRRLRTVDENSVLCSDLRAAHVGSLPWQLTDERWAEGVELSQAWRVKDSAKTCAQFFGAKKNQSDDESEKKIFFQFFYFDRCVLYFAEDDANGSHIGMYRSSDSRNKLFCRTPEHLDERLLCGATPALPDSYEAARAASFLPYLMYDSVGGRFRWPRVEGGFHVLRDEAKLRQLLLSEPHDLEIGRCGFFHLCFIEITAPPAVTADTALVRAFFSFIRTNYSVRAMDGSCVAPDEQVDVVKISDSVFYARVLLPDFVVYVLRQALEVFAAERWPKKRKTHFFTLHTTMAANDEENLAAVLDVAVQRVLLPVHHYAALACAPSRSVAAARFEAVVGNLDAMFDTFLCSNELVLYDVEKRQTLLVNQFGSVALMWDETRQVPKKVWHAAWNAKPATPEVVGDLAESFFFDALRLLFPALVFADAEKVRIAEQLLGTHGLFSTDSVYLHCAASSAISYAEEMERMRLQWQRCNYNADVWVADTRCSERIDAVPLFGAPLTEMSSWREFYAGDGHGVDLAAQRFGPHPREVVVRERLDQRFFEQNPLRVSVVPVSGRCGAGKTTAAKACIKDALERGWQVIWICPRDALVQQALLMDVGGAPVLDLRLLDPRRGEENFPPVCLVATTMHSLRRLPRVYLERSRTSPFLVIMDEVLTMLSDYGSKIMRTETVEPYLHNIMGCAKQVVLLDADMSPILARTFMDRLADVFAFSVLAPLFQQNIVARQVRVHPFEITHNNVQKQERRAQFICHKSSLEIALNILRDKLRNGERSALFFASEKLMDTIAKAYESMSIQGARRLKILCYSSKNKVALQSINWSQLDLFFYTTSAGCGVDIEVRDQLARSVRHFANVFVIGADAHYLSPTDIQQVASRVRNTATMYLTMHDTQMRSSYELLADPAWRRLFMTPDCDDGEKCFFDAVERDAVLTRTLDVLDARYVPVSFERPSVYTGVHRSLAFFKLIRNVPAHFTGNLIVAMLTKLGYKVTIRRTSDFTEEQLAAACSVALLHELGTKLKVTSAMPLQSVNDIYRRFGFNELSSISEVVSFPRLELLLRLGEKRLGIAYGAAYLAHRFVTERERDENWTPSLQYWRRELVRVHIALHALDDEADKQSRFISDMNRFGEIVNDRDFIFYEKTCRKEHTVALQAIVLHISELQAFTGIPSSQYPISELMDFEGMKAKHRRYSGALMVPCVCDLLQGKMLRLIDLPTSLTDFDTLRNQECKFKPSCVPILKQREAKNGSKVWRHCKELTNMWLHVDTVDHSTAFLHRNSLDVNSLLFRHYAQRRAHEPNPLFTAAEAQQLYERMYQERDEQLRAKTQEQRVNLSVHSALDEDYCLEQASQQSIVGAPMRDHRKRKRLVESLSQMALADLDDSSDSEL